MTRFALTLEYDGRGFMGLQRQPHGPSIQQAIEEAALALTGEGTSLHAAGRTDAGVHAVAMRAHLDIGRPITAFRLMEGLNALLRQAGHAIAVLGCAAVAEDWHARFSCLGRAYQYRIVNRRAPVALDAGRAWAVKRPLDANAMHDAAQVLVGHHDFTTFRSAHCQSASPVKTLDRLSVRREGEVLLVEAAARSFLHHQVRSMVGCLVLVGGGDWPGVRMGEALIARNRAALGLNAPAEGLYFVNATYPGEPA